MTAGLGGDDALNLPYEAIPGGPLELSKGSEISSGVVLLAATIRHPVTGEPHPAIAFRFSRGDGHFFPDRVLVVERDALDALIPLLQDTIAGAKQAADAGAVAGSVSDEPVGKTYEIVEDGHAIRCLRCGRTSWNLSDVKELHCSACGRGHAR